MKTNNQVVRKEYIIQCCARSEDYLKVYKNECLDELVLTLSDSSVGEDAVLHLTKESALNLINCINISYSLNLSIKKRD
jgi:hypothetical protein